jgi:hypothetical protein
LIRYASAGGGSGFFLVRVPSDTPDGFDKKELIVVIAAPPHLKSRTTLAGGGELEVLITEGEVDVEAR